MSTSAAIVLACSAVAGLVWFAFTRNGHRAVYVIVLAAHYRFVPAYGKHGHEEEPDKIRDMLRELALAAAASVRGCLRWPAGQMPREDLPAEVRHPAAEEVPAPLLPGRALPDGVNPYPPPTAPQPVLDLEPLPAARPYVSAGEGWLA